MDYLYPLLTLILLLILFHLIFIKFWKQGKVFWKKVDYWWVSLGVIGIIGSTFTFRKEMSVAWQPWHKQSLAAVYDQYQSDLQHDVKNYTDSEGYVNNLGRNARQKQQIIKAGEYLALLSRKVDSCKPLIISEQQYYLIDSVTEPYSRYIKLIKDALIADYIGDATFMCQRVKEEGNSLTELKNSENRDVLNWILLICSPYLFAIAISIRLTKVTAELTELKGK